MKEAHSRFLKTHGAKIYIGAIIALVIIGFVLRISGITWGIPFFHEYTKIFHPDEPKIVYGALQFPQFIWENMDFRYPIFYHNFLGLILYPLRMILDAMHVDSYYYIYLACRSVTVLLSTATLIMTYFVAKRWFGKASAFVTTALFTFSMCYVQESAWATTDVMTSFFAILFVILLTQIYTDKKTQWWRLAIAGIIFGFAYGTKYPAAILLVPLCIFQFDRAVKAYKTKRDKKTFLRELFHWHGLVILLFFLVGYLGSNAGIFWHPHSLIDSLSYEFGHQIGEAYIPYNDIQLYIHTWQILVIGFGLPVVISLFFGMIYPFKKTVLDWACTVAVLGLLIAFGGAFIPRFTIVVAPYIMLLAGRGIVAIGQDVTGKAVAAWRKWLSVIICAIVIGYSVYYGGAAVLSRLNEPREYAAEYIDKNIPAGSSIGVGFLSEKYPNVDWMYPKIDGEKFDLQSFIDRPDYIIISSAAVEYIDWAFAHPERMLSKYEWNPEYIKNWYRDDPPTPRVFEFYDKLLYTPGHNGYELQKSFSNHLIAPIDFMVEDIDVYKRIDE